MIFDDLRLLGPEVTACGSRVTCNPPPTDTDADFLVLCKDKDEQQQAIDWLIGEGFDIDSSEHYKDLLDKNDFTSWKKDEFNMLLTKNKAWARKHKAATHVCTTLNLMSKLARIMVFQAVLYGNCK